MRRNLWGSATVLALSFQGLFNGPSSNAAVTQGWNESFIKPCDCDTSFDRAFPKIFANRVDSKTEARFLKITTNLIEKFTASDEYKNSDKYIYWSVYELGAFDIVNALIAAKKAGVNVTVITDGKSVVEKPKNLLEKSESPSDDDADTEKKSHFADRHLLTKEAFKELRKNKIKLAFSDPEFVPVSTPYPPIMHEKIRIFAVKEGSEIVPTFAYVSTHNDTYSETIGDPLNFIPLSRLKEGELTAREIDPRSKGNVQTSFILRNQALLKVLFENTLDQVRTYGLGQGRIFHLVPRAPFETEFKDGTRVKLAFTYGRKRPTYNPNEEIKNFMGELLNEAPNTVSADIHLQQFVFSYGGASDNLKAFFEKNTRNVSMNVWVDGNFAFQPYSQARKMAGMYTVLSYRSDMPVDFPWKKSTRALVDARAYVNNFDKLHTKNSYIQYRTRTMSEPRYRIFTGSINLSSNGASNKELFFVIDTPATSMVNLMKKQQDFLGQEGFLKPIDDSGLFLRLKSTVQNFDSTGFKDTDSAYQAYGDFLKVIDKRTETAVYESFRFQPVTFFENDFVSSSWVESLGNFLSDVGAEKAKDPIMDDVYKNLKSVDKFYPSVSSVDILMHLTEQGDSINPKARENILKLFTQR